MRKAKSSSRPRMRAAHLGSHITNEGPVKFKDVNYLNVDPCSAAEANQPSDALPIKLHHKLAGMS